MYFNFRIGLLELEGVSSKQTYLDVVDHVITENNNYQQVTRKNCGGVIMTVIVMKLEMTCVPIILILISRTNVKTLSIIRCLENSELHYPQDYTIHGLLWDYIVELL